MHSAKLSNQLMNSLFLRTDGGRAHRRAKQPTLLWRRPATQLRLLLQRLLSLLGLCHALLPLLAIPPGVALLPLHCRPLLPCTERSFLLSPEQSRLLLLLRLLVLPFPPLPFIRRQALILRHLSAPPVKVHLVLHL